MLFRCLGRFLAKNLTNVMTNEHKNNDRLKLTIKTTEVCYNAFSWQVEKSLDHGGACRPPCNSPATVKNSQTERLEFTAWSNSGGRPLMCMIISPSITFQTPEKGFLMKSCQHIVQRSISIYLRMANHDGRLRACWPSS